jgi:hypothetical protein
MKPLETSFSTSSVMANTTPVALPSSTKTSTSSSAAKTGPRRGARNPSRSSSSPSSNVVKKIGTQTHLGALLRAEAQTVPEAFSTRQA